MNYITYIVLDPEQPGRYTSPLCSFLFKPVYIGKGRPRRLETITNFFKEDNCKQHAGKIFHDWLSAKKKNGIESVPVITLDALDEVDAFSKEALLVNHFGLKITGGILMNGRSGGSGGWSVSDYTKKLLSDLNSGENNPRWGKTWAPEQRDKWYAAWNAKPRNRTPESMAKTWEANKREYIISNGKETFTTDNLTNFCADNKLPLTAFRKALKVDGIVKSKLRASSVEGWTIKYLT